MPFNVGGGGPPAPGSIDTQHIANAAVTEEKLAPEVLAQLGGSLADGAVTTEKLANNAVTTDKIANDAVTYSKLQNVAANSVLARADGAEGDVSAVALAASRLFGRGSTGNIGAISLGTNLSFDGDVLNATGGTVNPGTNGFRLTPTSGTPVPASAATAVTTVYFTPTIRGNQIALWNGSAWEILSSAEVSLSLSGLAANSLFTLYAYNNGGSLALEWSAAWTNDTTPSEALATRDGVLVKSSDHTRRVLAVVGTTGSTGQTEFSFGGLAAGGSRARLLIGNVDNQVLFPVFVGSTTDSYTYGTTSFRNAENSTNLRAEWVTAIRQHAASALYNTYAMTSIATTSCRTAIGYDASTPGGSIGLWQAANVAGPLVARRDVTPAPGRHYFQALEAGAGTGTQTWYGDAGDATAYQTGLHALIWA